MRARSSYAYARRSLFHCLRHTREFLPATSDTAIAAGFLDLPLADTMNRLILEKLNESAR